MRLLVHKKAKRPRAGGRVERQRMHITKGDTVQVLSGDDKGKRGTVLRVYPKTGRVAIDGVNLAKRHRRGTQTTESGIVTFAAPIPASKVMLIDPKTNAPTRIRRQTNKDGTVDRIGVKSGVAIPRNR
ncbi:MAG TPA: 50S ribosomal protein L24 [Gemmatimonadales bacterium]|jgi:large subunit ribosomal protein L24